MILLWSSKGVALIALGYYDEAIDCYDEAIRLDPNYTLAWNNKILALDSLGEYDRAIKTYNEAVRINPEMQYI